MAEEPAWWPETRTSRCLVSSGSHRGQGRATAEGEDQARDTPQPGARSLPGLPWAQERGHLRCPEPGRGQRAPNRNVQSLPIADYWVQILVFSYIVAFASRILLRLGHLVTCLRPFTPKIGSTSPGWLYCDCRVPAGAEWCRPCRGPGATTASPSYRWKRSIRSRLCQASRSRRRTGWPCPRAPTVGRRHTRDPNGRHRSPGVHSGHWLLR